MSFPIAPVTEQILMDPVRSMWKYDVPGTVSFVSSSRTLEVDQLLISPCLSCVFLHPSYLEQSPVLTVIVPASLIPAHSHSDPLP